MSIIIENIDFEQMYNKLLFLYNIGGISMTEMSEVALIARKYNYKVNYNFELSNDKCYSYCHCSNQPKIITSEGFICIRCKKKINYG